MSRGLNKPLRFDLSYARTGQGQLTQITGKFIRVVDASSAAAQCELALRGDFNTSYFRMSEMATITERQGFDGIFITNEAQPGEWIEIVITDGPEDFDYERPMTNNIGEILTEVKVISGDTPLEIDAASTDALLTSILAMMQNDQDRRAPLSTLAGASYASGTGSTTIVSAGTNINGVVIRLARFTTSGTGAVCSLLAGGNLLLQTMNTNKSDMPLQNIFVPAGVAITSSVAGSGEWYIWYEVL